MTDKPDLDVTAPRQMWVCVASGIQLEKGGKGVVFKTVEDGGALGSQKIYGLAKFRSARVGTIYSINVTANGDCYPKTLRYQTQFKDKELLADWEAEQLGRDAEDERKKALRDAKHATLIEEQLKPLRNAYLKCSYRAGFELAVLRYLRTGNLS